MHALIDLRVHTICQRVRSAGARGPRSAVRPHHPPADRARAADPGRPRALDVGLHGLEPARAWPPATQLALATAIGHDKTRLIAVLDALERRRPDHPRAGPVRPPREARAHHRRRRGAPRGDRRRHPRDGGRTAGGLTADQRDRARGPLRLAPAAAPRRLRGLDRFLTVPRRPLDLVARYSVRAPLQSRSRRPDDLVASIVALTERTTKLALDSTMEAAQADALGKLSVVVEQVCRLAVGCGVAAGEIGWLVTELGTSGADAVQLAEAERAIAGLQSAVISVAFAVEEFSASEGRSSSAPPPMRCAARRSSSTTAWSAAPAVSAVSETRGALPAPRAACATVSGNFVASTFGNARRGDAAGDLRVATRLFKARGFEAVPWPRSPRRPTWRRRSSTTSRPEDLFFDAEDAVPTRSPPPLPTCARCCSTAPCSAGSSAARNSRAISTSACGSGPPPSTPPPPCAPAASSSPTHGLAPLDRRGRRPSSAAMLVGLINLATRPRRALLADQGPQDPARCSARRRPGPGPALALPRVQVKGQSPLCSGEVGVPGVNCPAGGVGVEPAVADEGRRPRRGGGRRAARSPRRAASWRAVARRASR